MKKKLTALSVYLLTALLVFSTVAYAAAENNGRDQDRLFQYSTINAVMQGQYDGEMTLKELNTHGSMGLGTLNGLDGELIQLDNKFYQVNSKGQVKELKGNVKTPFAVTTEFDAEKTVTLSNVKDFQDFSEKLKTKFDNKNHFYAIKIHGKFDSIKNRSVPKQTRPYPPLTEVTPHQTVFEENNVRGTIIGFYTPNYASSIQVPGFHMHFLSDDKTKGGHILDVKFDSAKVEIQQLSEFDLVLPDTADFANADLTKTTVEDIEEAERGK
ncbi:acetolactate decarboxylase [Paenibacillus sp. JNUCC31]|uniref:acetolactate decarboxylase n=1 Tax=Paenibacillus sp. JNUCC-31 TaxID=2777983 RepID=UPI00177EDF39|nr:acetolactate decarboxylase [Paenibacillus sp. JNUCC-31]QOS81888.1 acetolactate decarboxylase [Paenibacillus sp. JNUCC-31]